MIKTHAKDMALDHYKLGEYPICEESVSTKSYYQHAKRSWRRQWR